MISGPQEFTTNRKLRFTNYLKKIHLLNLENQSILNQSVFCVEVIRNRKSYNSRRKEEAIFVPIEFLVPYWDFNSLKDLCRILDIATKEITQQITTSTQFKPLIKAIFFHYLIDFIIAEINENRLLTPEVPKSIDTTENSILISNNKLVMIDDKALTNHIPDEEVIDPVELRFGSDYQDYLHIGENGQQSLLHFYPEIRKENFEVRNFIHHLKEDDMYITLKSFNYVTETNFFVRMKSGNLYSAIKGDSKQVVDSFPLRSKELKEHVDQFKAYRSVFNENRKLKIAVIGDNTPQGKYQYTPRDLLNNTLESLLSSNDKFTHTVGDPNKAPIFTKAATFKEWKSVFSNIQTFFNLKGNFEIVNDSEFIIDSDEIKQTIELSDVTQDPVFLGERIDSSDRIPLTYAKALKKALDLNVDIIINIEPKDTFNIGIDDFYRFLKVIQLYRDGEIFIKNYKRPTRTNEGAIYLGNQFYTVLVQLFLDANYTLGGENYRLLPYDLSDPKIPLVISEKLGELYGLEQVPMRPKFFEEFKGKKITFVGVDLSINSYKQKDSYRIGISKLSTINLSTGEFSTSVLGEKIQSSSEKLPHKIGNIFHRSSIDSDLLVIIRDNYFLSHSNLLEICNELRKENQIREL